MMKSKIFVVLVAGILIGGSIGFGGAFLLYTPRINDLTTELSDLESQYWILSDRSEVLSEGVEVALFVHIIRENKYKELQKNNTALQTFYQNMCKKYEELIKEYNNLTFVAPVGEMIVTDIPGVINGDFEDRNEGWVRQGKGGIDWGVAYLHQYDNGTFLTQTVTFDSKDQGLAFLVKPAPVGAEVGLRVSLGGVVLFSETYSGIDADFDWEKVLIPVKALFEMKGYYGLEAEGRYEIRFTVPPGEDNGARILIDNITLAKIEHQPEEPEPS